MNSNYWSDTLGDAIEVRRRAGLVRSLPCSDLASGFIKVNGRQMLNLNSNDYLNLSIHPDVIQAAELAIHQGVGSGSARLLGGDSEWHRQFEDAMSKRHGSEAALVFNNGYAANIGAITAMSTYCSDILADKLNHASLIDGMKLGGKPFVRYRHGEMEHLESLLKKSKSPEKTLVISETLFSMDGDFAPLEELFDLQKKFGFFLYLDEAHSFGGYPEIFSIIKSHMSEKLAVMGTLGKALGSSGAFVCGSQKLIDVLINFSRSFIYSTALPAHLLAAAKKSLEVIDANPWMMQNLNELANDFRCSLGEAGFNTLDSRSHIVPVMIGEPESAILVSEKLSAAGYYSLAVRPPTVPEGKSRLRISLTHSMKLSQLKDFFSVLQSCSHLVKRFD